MRAPPARQPNWLGRICRPRLNRLPLGAVGQQAACARLQPAGRARPLAGGRAGGQSACRRLQRRSRSTWHLEVRLARRWRNKMALKLVKWLLRIVQPPPPPPLAGSNRPARRLTGWPLFGPNLADGRRSCVRRADHNERRSWRAKQTHRSAPVCCAERLAAEQSLCRQPRALPSGRQVPIGSCARRLAGARLASWTSGRLHADD